MIQPNELKIGNLVYAGVNFENSDITKPLGLVPIKVQMGFTSTENLYPIPLTPEILEKAGFKKLSYDFEFWKNSMWRLKQHKLNNEWYLTHCGEEVDCIKIKYLHQLQNLYFALTGEELNIEL